MLNSRAFPGYWYGFPCVLESHGGRSMRRKGELVCPPVSSSHGQTLLLLNQQSSSSWGAGGAHCRRCLLCRAAQWQQKCCVPLWGNRTLSYLSLMAELLIGFGGSLKMWVANAGVGIDAETELFQGFQSMSISRYFQVSVLHCDCWVLISH